MEAIHEVHRKHSPSESIIQKEILNYLKDRGAWAVKVIMANQAGCPDILCNYRGRFVAIEIKREGGKLSTVQKYQLAQIQAEGGVITVATCVDTVTAVLDGIDQQIKTGEI
jgi:hypothetical protein